MLKLRDITWKSTEKPSNEDELCFVVALTNMTIYWDPKTGQLLRRYPAGDWNTGWEMAT